MKLSLGKANNCKWFWIELAPVYVGSSFRLSIFEEINKFLNDLEQPFFIFLEIRIVDFNRNE